LLLLVSFYGRIEAQKILKQDYNFLMTDGGVSKLHQSNDTLYELHCYIDRPCQPTPEDHYKIISSVVKGSFAILKLEKLDSIALTTNPYPLTRYSVLVFKNIDDQHLRSLNLRSGLTRQQLDTVRTNVASLADKFFFTFYSDSYLKELAKLKKITTMEDANQIMEAMKSDEIKALARRYEATDVADLYGSGFSAEVLNRACIEKGYDPVGAGGAIDKLLREKRNKEKGVVHLNHP